MQLVYQNHHQRLVAQKKGRSVNLVVNQTESDKGVTNTGTKHWMSISETDKPLDNPYRGSPEHHRSRSPLSQSHRVVEMNLNCDYD